MGMLLAVTLGVLAMRTFALCFFSVTALIVPGAAQPLAAAQAGGTITVERPVISADEAPANVGKECTVEFVVTSSRMLGGKGPCFLNSKKNHRDLGNFTVVIFQSGLESFAAADIADPASEYLDKKIRVGGAIREREGQAQIVIEAATQLEVVPTEAAGDADGS